MCVFVNARAWICASVSVHTCKPGCAKCELSSVCVSVFVHRALARTSTGSLSLLTSAAPMSPPGRGVRILCLDGGGVRGLLILEMLRRMEKDTGKRVLITPSLTHSPLVLLSVCSCA